MALVLEVAPSALVAETVTRNVAGPDMPRTVRARNPRENASPDARDRRVQQRAWPSTLLRLALRTRTTPLGSRTQTLTDLAVVGLALAVVFWVAVGTVAELATSISIPNSRPASTFRGLVISILSFGLPEGVGGGGGGAGAGSTVEVGSELVLAEPAELAALTSTRIVPSCSVEVRV